MPRQELQRAFLAAPERQGCWSRQPAQRCFFGRPVRLGESLPSCADENELGRQGTVLHETGGGGELLQRERGHKACC
eukprot:6632764-Pyramimonas_sp.AAC.1